MWSPTHGQVFIGALVILTAAWWWQRGRGTRAGGAKREKFTSATPPGVPGKPRVIIVPGLGGSMLDATWNFPKSALPAKWCSMAGSEQIWPSLYSVTDQTCWGHEFGTTISSNGYISSNSDVSPVGWGTLAGISTLLSLDIGFMDVPVQNYFKDVISTLYSAGYTDVVGAPYDFRIISNEDALNSFYQALDGLVTETQETSGVVLMGHSLGCALIAGYLSQASQTSIDRITKFVAIAGPFAGAPKALESVVSGSQIGVPLTSDQFMNSIEKTLGGVIAMIPITTTGVWTDAELVVDPGSQQANILTTLGLSRNQGAAQAYLALKSKFWKSVVVKPRVPTTLIHGDQLPTVGKLDYSTSYTKPVITYVEGDGTVPMASLQAPQTYGWETTTHIVPKGDHFKILMDTYFLQNLPTWMAE
jgi:pimeloyl-ACP methyl ester carboxylesterase